MKRSTQFFYLAIMYTCLLNVLMDTSSKEKVHKNQIENGYCPTASTVVVSVVPGGRLGNLAWEYLSAWLLAQDLPNAINVVPQKMINDLSTVFVNITALSIEELAAKCNATDLLQEYLGTPITGNIDPALLQRAQSNETRSRPLLLVKGAFIFSIYYTSTVWPQLHEQLPFKPELEDQAQKTLNAIKHETIKKKHGVRKVNDLQYVAVHVRRSDYPEYLRSRFTKEVKIVDEHFYFKAMDEMRRRLYPKTIAFVMVSDDRQWCRKHFSWLSDVFISGNSNSTDPGPDLALLSACNHTIFAYGTYALTAAMHNAEGHTIVFNTGQLTAAVTFAMYLNWTLI